MSLRSSVDSDLEAFSHNPADGSFAPLAVQPSASAKHLVFKCETMHGVMPAFSACI